MPLHFRLSTFINWILGMRCWFCLSCFSPFSFLFRPVFGPSQHRCVIVSFPVSSFSFLLGCYPGEPVLHCGGATCVCGLVAVAVGGLQLQQPLSLRSSWPPISRSQAHMSEPK